MHETLRGHSAVCAVLKETLHCHMAEMATVQAGLVLASTELQEGRTREEALEATTQEILLDSAYSQAVLAI